MAGCHNRCVSAPDHETAPDAAATAPSQVTDQPEVFRIGGLAYFGPIMMLVTALVLAGTSLAYLGWTLLVPFVVAFWMYRIRTVADADGVRAVGTFRTRAFAWTELTGLSFPRWGSVRAELADGSRVRLPAVSFRDLPRLSRTSAGRIPDPYAAKPDAPAASDDEPADRDD
ncbi:PH domain-containing protein [Williamsia serinedens]|uniref:PH domain-containing protein n=1 Tax=Williamsia serinedens TaxID=391736 RepID=A0ABT1H235_9NOCA|nr:PH domain-containing protein [Williamsia serinedens]